MFPSIRPPSQSKQTRPSLGAVASGSGAGAVGFGSAPANAGARGVAKAEPEKSMATEKYTLQEAELDIDDGDDDPSKYQELPLESEDDDDEKTDDIGFGVVGGDTDASNKREDDELHEYLKTLKFKNNQTNGAKVLLDAELTGSPAKKPSTADAYGASSSSAAAADGALGGAAVVRKPTVVDDFIRNFFVKLQLRKSLEAFQSEWYELSAAGKLNPEDVVGSGGGETGGVADIYVRNEQLDQSVKSLRSEVGRMTRVADQARATWDKFRKERDFHRMHHRRVVQEKNSLIRDMKRLKKTIFTFQPLLSEAKKKYEVAMKETMLYKLERDRLQGKVEALETQLKSFQTNVDIRSPVSDRKQMESTGKSAVPSSAGTAAGHPHASPKHMSKRLLTSAGYSNARIERQTPSNKISAAKAMTKVKGDSALPDDDRPNPYADATYSRAAVDKFVLRKTFRGHKMAVSGVAVHPTKPVVATVSDDRTWKMWSVPNGDLIMSGDGHTDWVSAAAFHPKGHALLATASGDATVKLWDFMNAKCSATFSDHKHAVWSVAFHDSGDFLASASQDCTARLWDINSSRCRQTFRGHEKSVNCVAFAPFANTLATASSDKSASVWDVRSSLCVQTFKGNASVCKVAYNLQGNTLAAADYDGVVTLWDVRNLKVRVAPGASAGAGVKTATAAGGAGGAATTHPAHDCCFDNSGEVMAVASYDGSIKLFSTADGAEIATLLGHEEAVQAVRFDRDSSYLISAASDATWRIWS